MKHILLIEDDEVMRESTAEILELSGYNVTTAVNGREGAHFALQINPDLILCDIMMPELDGYSVFNMLSRNPKTSKVPFIFLSAKAEKSEVRKGMNLGADDYLTKPFEESDLIMAVETRIKKKIEIQSFELNNQKSFQDFLEVAKKFNKIDKLSELSSKVKIKKKFQLFHAGEKPSFVYFLTEGKIKIFQTHSDGKEFILQVVSQGEFFGHIPVFQNSLYTDNAELLEDSELYKIPIDNFWKLVLGDRDIASYLIKFLASNVEQSEQRLLSLAYDTVKKRTANALFELHQKVNLDHKNSKEVPLNFTRDDIASMVGTATETVIRALTEFKEDGLIESKGRSIYIIDLEALKNASF